MSSKELVLLIFLLGVGVLGMLAYADVYPPSDATDGLSSEAASNRTPQNLSEEVDAGGDLRGSEAPPLEANAGAPQDFPPGLGGDRVENPTVLSRTHRDLLLGAGSWTQHTSTTVYVNGTQTVSSERTARVSERGNRAAGSVQVTGERPGVFDLYGPDLSYWANESLTYVRFRDSNRTSAIERDDRYPVPFDVESTEWWTLYRLFGQTDTSFEGSIERDGTTLYRVVGTKSVYYDSPFGDVRDVTLSALVTGDGLVEEYVVTFLRSAGDRETRVVVRVEYTEVGTTTVARPAWIPERPDNVSQAPDTATDAGVDSMKTGAIGRWGTGETTERASNPQETPATTARTG